MRREWTALIRERNWAEFERLAKTEPTQQLADTVAELERGLTEKQDRRALKKILWMLSQAGLEPQEVETEEPLPAAAAQYGRAMVIGADLNGDSMTILGIEERQRVRWLQAAISVEGIRHAFEEETVRGEADAYFEATVERYRRSFLVAEVPLEYALWRVAKALREHPDRVPSRIAYWRKRLELAQEAPHPGEAIPARETTADERRMLSLHVREAAPWRLDPGIVARVLAELGEVAGADVDAEARVEERLTAARKTMFTEALIADHALRLVDGALAFLQVEDAASAGLFMSARADLLDRGPESDYARGLAAKSIVLLAERWKQEERARSEAGRP